MTELKVGDRIEGKVSGHTGIVTKVYPDGLYIDGDKDNGDRWERVRVSGFTLLERRKGGIEEYGAPGAAIRRWRYSNDDMRLEIESSIAKDGDVLLRMPGKFCWIRKDDLEDVINTLREAAKTACRHCDGTGRV